MSNIINQVKDKRNSQQGFTIVELLIVIVVIAILAAITIVAYNGIQSRAKTSSAAEAAAGSSKKAELYNTDVGYYPLTFAAMTGASSSSVYQLTGVTFATSLSNTSAPATVIYQICGSGSPASVAAITSTNIVGANILYRDYVNSTNLTDTAGVTSGAGIACFTTAS